MNTDNQIILFIAELVKRLFAKSPLFFKVIQIIGVVVAIITGLPALLESWHIVLPDALQVLENKVVAIASLVGTFIALLTVERTALTPGNNVVKATREGKVFLPFTAKAEQKQIQEAQPEPAPVVKPKRQYNRKKK